MFTGIIERTVLLRSTTSTAAGMRLMFDQPWADVRHGESIAVNGVCLTVAEIADGRLAFDVITETLNRTNLGRLRGGDVVNLERALRASDRIDGHFVQGHVDGVATIMAIRSDVSDWRIEAEVNENLGRYLSPKGSVTLDGVSLTLAALRGNRFEVALIPTTLQRTSLATRTVGWPLNFEADILTKTVVSWLERREAAAQDTSRTR